MWPFRQKQPPPAENNKSRRQMERADKAVETSEKALEASRESREDVRTLIAKLRSHRKGDSWNEEIEKIMGEQK